MPVTAKLSRKFYDQFGDEIANELVEWFNNVDETYRSELRALNELNFARFDSKLEQRLAELRGDLRGEIAVLRGDLRDEMAKQGDALRTQVSSLELGTANAILSQTRWMIGLWAAQITVFIGTVLVVLRGP